MDPELIRLNEQRTYWHEKARRQLDELLMLSIEQKTQKHEDLNHQLGTTLIVIWRLDQRLSTQKVEYGIYDSQARSDGGAG